jgi:glucose-1-phosphate thymidylyltransferase
MKSCERDVFEAERDGLHNLLNDQSVVLDKVWVVILAAGYGTRMTNNDIARNALLQGRPKALLPLPEGRTILDRIMDGLRPASGSIGGITVVTNELFVDALEKWRQRAAKHWDGPINVISNGTVSPEKRKGAVGDLHFAVTREDIRHNVLVLGSDNVFDDDFGDFINCFLRESVATIGIHEVNDPQRLASKLGFMDVDISGRIVSFDEKPEQPRSAKASTLCYLFTRREILLLKRYIREHSAPDNTGDFIKYLISQNVHLKGYEFRKNWYDIETSTEYDIARGRRSN